MVCCRGTLMDAFPLLFLLLLFFCVASPIVIAIAAPAGTEKRCAPFPLLLFLEAQFGHKTDTAARHCAADAPEASPWDTAATEFSLRCEMEHWIRANRSVGMPPEAYVFVWNEVMRLTDHLRGGTGETETQTDGGWRQREMHVYATRANATLRAMPWLRVTNETLAAAWRRQAEVRGRHIMRTFHISGAAGDPAALRVCLKRVAKWWAEAERRVAGAARVPPPLLPWISLESLIGPPLDIAALHNTSAEDTGHNEKGAKSAKASVQQAMPRQTFRFLPSRIPLPSAVVFYYAAHCPSCDAIGAAFDLLPMIYRRLCEYGHQFIVRCSPLVLFFRAEAGPSQLFVPSVFIHGVPKLPVPAISPFPSLIMDLDELINTEDVFDGIDVPLGGERQAISVLHSILRRMIRYGLVEPRFLSHKEAREMERAQRAAEGNEDGENRSKRGNVTENMGNSTIGNETGNTAAERRRAGRVVALDTHLRDVLAFHLVELWGNTTPQDQISNSVSRPVDPMWFQFVCFALTALWFTLLIWGDC